jgi:hypothetical protein
MRFFRLNDEIVQGIPRTKFIASDYQMHPLDELIHVDADDVTISLPHSERFVSNCTFTVMVNGHKGVKIDDTPINEGVDSVIIIFSILEGIFKMTYRVRLAAKPAHDEFTTPALLRAKHNFEHGSLLEVSGVNATDNPDYATSGKIVNGGVAMYVSPGDLLSFKVDDPLHFAMVNRAVKESVISVAAAATKALVGKEVFPYEAVTVNVSCGATGDNTVVTLPTPEVGYNSLLCVKLVSRPGLPVMEIKVPTGVKLDGVLNGSITDKLESESTFFRAVAADEWEIV